MKAPICPLKGFSCANPAKDSVKTFQIQVSLSRAFIEEDNLFTFDLFSGSKVFCSTSFCYLAYNKLNCRFVLSSN